MNRVHDLYLQNVIFELDCKQASNNMKCFSTNVTKYGFVLSLCKKKLCLIKNSSLSLVHKQVKLVAYSLAQASRFFVSPHFFIAFLIVLVL